MAIASTPVDSSFASLAAQLFKSVDGNKDGKLSSDEFQSFLDGLLNRVGRHQTHGLGTEATAGNPTAAGTTVGPTVYQAMLGFDYGKLNNPAHTTPKYVFARATQDVPLSFDRPSRSAGLQQLADYVKTHGYPNVTVTGDDTMDFGDGNGDIDVLTSDGQWWWGPRG